MDKIVSPVVPQPGAWKRPPRLVSSGSRKPSRRSTSVSEPELLSPSDETKSMLSDGKLVANSFAALNFNSNTFFAFS